MACIQREAAQATAVYLVDNNENVNNFKPAFNELPGLIATADAASKPGYQTALNVGYNGAKGLDDAMGAINASIVTQALNKSVRPDVQKISTEISSSLNQQQTKTKDAEAANSSSGHRKLEHALDIAQADIDITNMVNFAATFDKDITACKTLAGA